MPGFLPRATALAALVVALCAGCSRGSESPASVSGADLQKSLVDQLAQSGTPTTWVNCPKDLPGRVGAVTRCDVKFGADNAVTALLTTTQVSGDKITWEITGPELTKDQVTSRLKGMTSAESAACDSGLKGRTGEWVLCQVTKNGVMLNEAVEVKDVRGLSLDLTLTPMIPVKQLEASVVVKAAPLYSRQVDSAQCGGDLPGTLGATVECVVMLGDNPETVVVTVTGASGGAIDFEVSKRFGGKPKQGDKCPGCIG